MATVMIMVVVAHVCVCVCILLSRVGSIRNFNALAVDSYRVNHCS